MNDHIKRSQKTSLEHLHRQRHLLIGLNGFEQTRQECGPCDLELDGLWVRDTYGHVFEVNINIITETKADIIPRTKTKIKLTVVVAQLVVRSLPTPEVRSSNPGIG